MFVLRRALALLISAILALLGLLLIFSKGGDFGSSAELLPVGFFVVVLSLAAYAMTWCSNGKTFSPPRNLAEVYQCSGDLFQSSLLALLSSAMVTLSKISPLPATIKYTFYGLHWLLFSVAILLAWWAIHRLLGISTRPNLNIEPAR
jgi:hypothetical protein